MSKGFTLIELMSAMVIISILAALIYPSYMEYIIRTKRSDGQTALIDLANRMETYYSEHNSYAGATIGTGNPSDVRSSSETTHSWYQLIIKSTDTSYNLEARPLIKHGFKDQYCQTLTLDSMGNKNITHSHNGSSPSGLASNCW